jgi:hypothetical protein
MSLYYNVQIIGSKDEISFISSKSDDNATNNNDSIKEVIFKFNSDDDSKERDRNARIELRIKGSAETQEFYKNMTKLANWSKETSDVYRTVKIEIFTIENTDAEGNIRRTFEFDSMFCLDYQETFCEDGVSFDLFIAQRANHKVSTIKYEVI